MTIKEKVEKIVDKKKDISSSSSYKRKMEYYKKLKAKGILNKQNYNIPPIDTIGSSIYKLKQNCSS